MWQHIEGPFRTNKLWPFVDAWRDEADSKHVWLKCKYCTFYKEYSKNKPPQHDAFKSHLVSSRNDDDHRTEELATAMAEQAKDRVVPLSSKALTTTGPTSHGTTIVKMFKRASEQEWARGRGSKIGGGDKNRMFHALVMDFFVQCNVPFQVRCMLFHCGLHVVFSILLYSSAHVHRHMSLMNSGEWWRMVAQSLRATCTVATGSPDTWGMHAHCGMQNSRAS